MKWNELSMEEKNSIIRKGVLLGLTSLKDILNRYVTGGEKDTILKEAVVTPEQWQSDFTNAINKYYPGLSMGLLSDISADSEWKAANGEILENEAPYNAYNVWKRLYELYLDAGSPKVLPYGADGLEFTDLEGNPRAYSIVDDNSMYVTPTMDDFLAELAHFTEAKYNKEKSLPWNTLVERAKYLGFTPDDDYERYLFPDDSEGATHGFYEPAMLNYILTGKYLSTGNLLKREEIADGDDATTTIDREVEKISDTWFKKKYGVDRKSLGGDDPRLELYRKHCREVYLNNFATDIESVQQLNDSIQNGLGLLKYSIDHKINVPGYDVNGNYIGRDIDEPYEETRELGGKLFNPGGPMNTSTTNYTYDWNNAGTDILKDGWSWNLDWNNAKIEKEYGHPALEKALDIDTNTEGTPQGYYYPAIPFYDNNTIGLKKFIEKYLGKTLPKRVHWETTEDRYFRRMDSLDLSELPISKNTKVNIQNYWDSPVADARRAVMFSNPEYALSTKEAAALRARDVRIIAEDYDGGSRTNGYEIYMLYNLDLPFLKDKSRGVLAHELGHVIYPAGPEDAEDFWRNNLSKEYKKHLAKFNDRLGTDPEVILNNDLEALLKAVYGNSDPGWLQGEYMHDLLKSENIPFIYEAREDMKSMGIWDYTTGAPLTKELYEEYLRRNPRSRLGNFTDAKNALWLLNNTAANSNTQSVHTSPDMDYSHMNISSYGGNIYDGTTEPTQKLNKEIFDWRTLDRKQGMSWSDYANKKIIDNTIKELDNKTRENGMLPYPIEPLHYFTTSDWKNGGTDLEALPHDDKFVSTLGEESKPLMLINDIYQLSDGDSDYKYPVGGLKLTVAHEFGHYLDWANNNKLSEDPSLLNYNLPEYTKINFENARVANASRGAENFNDIINNMNYVEDPYKVYYSGMIEHDTDPEELWADKFMHSQYPTDTDRYIQMHQKACGGNIYDGTTEDTLLMYPYLLKDDLTQKSDATLVSPQATGLEAFLEQQEIEDDINNRVKYYSQYTTPYTNYQNNAVWKQLNSILLEHSKNVPYLDLQNGNFVVFVPGKAPEIFNLESMGILGGPNGLENDYWRAADPERYIEALNTVRDDSPARYMHYDSGMSPEDEKTAVALKEQKDLQNAEMLMSLPAFAIALEIPGLNYAVDAAMFGHGASGLIDMYRNGNLDLEHSGDIALNTLEMLPGTIKGTRYAVPKAISYVDRGFVPESRLLTLGPNTLTRFIGTGDSGYEDALTSGIIRGNPSPPRYPQALLVLLGEGLKRVGLEESDIRDFISNNIRSEELFNRINDALGHIKGNRDSYKLANSYLEYLKDEEAAKLFVKTSSYLSNVLSRNPETNDWISSWGDNNLATFALEGEELANDLLFPGDYAVLINNADKWARTATSRGHFAEHPTTVKPMPANHHDVTFYKRRNGLLTGKKYMVKLSRSLAAKDAKKYRTKKNSSKK